MTNQSPPDDQPVVVDSLLELLIKFSESKDGKPSPFSIDITLATNGMLVSGKLIEYREYLGHFAGFSDKLKEAMLKDLDEDNADEKPRNFIHLKDAFFFTPGQNPIPSDGTGVYWRAKLTSISGFNFGRLKNEIKTS